MRPFDSSGDSAAAWKGPGAAVYSSGDSAAAWKGSGAAVYSSGDSVDAGPDRRGTAAPYSTASQTDAIPCPTPMHMVASP